MLKLVGLRLHPLLAFTPELQEQEAKLAEQLRSQQHA